VGVCACVCVCRARSGRSDALKSAYAAQSADYGAAMARVETEAARRRIRFALDSPTGGWLASRADPARPRSSDALARTDQNDAGAQRLLHAGVAL
jgi:hypothetical protein